MKRRKFIYDSSFIALSVGVFGNIKWDGKSYVGDDPTTTDILGPFYRPNAPFKTDLIQPGTKGEVLHFNGTVFGKDGKTPLQNALVEIWHCNENGEYDNTSDDYVYRASAKTSADGKYSFKTILPVPYAAGPTLTRPAHIHMRVSNTNMQDLVTQIYFKGDKHIAGDISAKDPSTLNRILDIKTNDKKEKLIKFDIFLKEEYVLDAAAFKKIEGLYEMQDKTMAEFYRQGDQLFAKMNGQIMEAMDYKGDNTFSGALDYIKAKFEVLSKGGMKVAVTIAEGNAKTVEGTKLLKY
jgi:protocatechuate 3,4-dioxygenase beta subunit